MATSKNAKIQMESGRVLVTFEALTDSGDAQNFNPSESIMSGREGFAPEVVPDGVLTGVDLVSTAVSGTNDVVDVKAFTCALAGAETSVAADSDVAITRPLGDFARINSITVDSGGNIVVIAGTEAADQVFLETRGTAGGAPYIPVGSIEIAQVRLKTSAAAPITASEIFQNPGQHFEQSGYPIWNTNNIGLGTYAEDAAQVNAFVEMNSALPLIHTGDKAKGVYAQYYAPTFADLVKTLEFVPAEKSHSVTSTEFYGGSIASSSESLGQASFTALLTNGVSDAEVTAKNTIATFKFYPDRNKTAYILTQGIVGVGRTFPVGDQNQASMTVSSEVESAEFVS